MSAGETEDKWREYYDRTAGRPARPTLLHALAGFAGMPGRRSAVDLGCGDGRDTIELLRRGWLVLAIDAESAAIERLKARPDLPPAADLQTICGRIEDSAWPAVDLVNASFVLPLCPPERFPELWTRILASLKPGGRFAGQLYGDRDGWVGKPGVTHLARPAVERLLAALEIEFFEEEETEAPTYRGKPKHWHIFHIVARKP